MKIAFRISHQLGIVASLWLFFISIVILIDIIGRAGFSKPLAGTAEIVEASIVCIAFLQLPQCVAIGGLMRAEMLDSFVSARVLRMREFISNLLGAALFGAVALGAWEPMKTAWEIGEYTGHSSTLQIPTIPVHLTLFSCSVFTTLIFVLRLFDRNHGDHVDTPFEVQF